jgi:hypothetical protein
VIEQSDLYLVYDELHFALPRKLKKSTSPIRLDWLRCHVIDRHKGCAFFATRQTYHTTMKRFIRITEHQMEQWVGRVAPPLILPAEMDQPELFPAAKALYPRVRDELLSLIVERTIQTESGFRYLQAVIGYAIFLAGEDGRDESELVLKDADLAMQEMLPGTADALGLSVIAAPRPDFSAKAKPSSKNSVKSTKQTEKTEATPTMHLAPDNGEVAQKQGDAAPA